MRDSAQVRVDLALAFMRDEGIEGTGEVGDADPFNAAMDAIGAHGIDEIIISTLPAVTSGWLRRDLPGAPRARDRRCRSSTSWSTSTPRACRSTSRSCSPTRPPPAASSSSASSSSTRRARTASSSSCRRTRATAAPCGAARERLAQLLQSLEADGIVAAGMIGDPDPYTAARNALEYFHLSEIVISTLPSNRSAWIEKGLVEKLERDSGKRVVHVESSADQPAEASA